MNDDELMRKFWEIENPHFQEPTFSIDERSVMEHFKEKHYRNADGRFVVPLPINSRAVPLGESRTMAVRRFKNLEQSLYRKGQVERFAHCVEEYFELSHAEPVPAVALKKPCDKSLLYAYACSMERIEHYNSAQGSVRCFSQDHDRVIFRRPISHWTHCTSAVSPCFDLFPASQGCYDSRCK